MNTCVKKYCLVVFIIFPALFGFTGCGAPSGTLDLLTVARKGIELSAQQQSKQHAEIIKHLRDKLTSLDSAFDADLTLIEAGQIKDSNGQPIPLTGSWVITARKGYIAVRDILWDQIQSAETAHRQSLENIKTTHEVLERACELIVSQWQVAEKVKQHVLHVQRRILNEQ